MMMMKSKRDAIKRNSGQITNTNVSLGYGFQFKVNFELADIYLTFGGSVVDGG